MVKQKRVGILKQGAWVWNKWREKRQNSWKATSHLPFEDLSGVDLRGADLSGAYLTRADLSNANLTEVNLTEADLVQADLQNAHLYKADLMRTNLTEAHLLLILGRFTPERKPVLDALKDELRNHNYLPVVFDFKPSAKRDLTETISLLARMSRFVIADLTDAKSIPQELENIIPHLPSVPVQPILQRDATEYAMFELSLIHI